MPTPPLPRHADFRKFVAAGVRLSGFVPLAELHRIRDVVQGTQGEAQCQLGFGVDEEGHKVVSGSVKAVLELECQRCLEAVQLPVSSELSLAMVWSEKEIPSLPSRFEGLVVGEGLQDLFDLVEEELLLSMPLVPRHPDGECSLAAGIAAVVGVREKDEGKGSPFLAALGGDDKTGA